MVVIDVNTSIIDDLKIVYVEDIEKIVKRKIAG
jgi:hypothetical protein